MGRKPPDFLFGSRVALQRWGVMEVGAQPVAMNLVSEVRTKFARSGEGHSTASHRWLGRRPDGPGADPLGKDFTPLRMIDSGKVDGGGTGPESRVGGGACGCFEDISARTSGDRSASPSEVSALMALLYWPSWVARFALRILCEVLDGLVLSEECR